MVERGDEDVNAMFRSDDDEHENEAEKSAGDMWEPKDLKGPKDRTVADVPAIPVAIVDGPHVSPDSSPRFETGHTFVGSSGQPAVVQVLGKQLMRQDITLRLQTDNKTVGITSSVNGQLSDAWILNSNASGNRTLELKTTDAIYIISGDGTQVEVQWVATFLDG